MTNRTFLVAFALAAATTSHAHLKANSLLPVTGSTVKVGDQVTITFGVQTGHIGGVDIQYTKNNGQAWSMIKAGLLAPNVETYSFKWTVPAEAVSDNAILRICQVPPCVDTMIHDRISGNGAPWRLVSTLKIQSPTAVIPTTNSGGGLVVEFDPATRNIGVAFNLTEASQATLQAFNLEGRLVATLIDGKFESGSHRLSVFANSLLSAQGLILKLNAGGQSRSHTWMPIH